MKQFLRDRLRRKKPIYDRNGATPDIDLTKNMRLREEFIDLKRYQSETCDITEYDIRNISIVSELHYAAYNNDVVAIKHLIFQGIHVNDRTDGCPKLIPEKHNDNVHTTYAAFFEGTTPLMMASYYGNKTVMRILMKAGASVAVKDCVGNTALAVAVSNRQLNCCKFLRRRGADMNIADVSGSTLLILACSKNNYEICKWLIKKGAKVRAFDREGRTCLHYAAWNSNQPMIRKLLGFGIEPNVRDVYGKTPLHYAVENDHLKFRTTIDLLANQNDWCHGRHVGVWKTVVFLLNKGADCNAQDLHLTTPSHALINNLPKANIVNGVVYCDDNRSNELFLVILVLLLKFGADMNLPDDCGKTAMSLINERSNLLAMRISTKSSYKYRNIHKEKILRSADKKRTTSCYRHNDACTIEKNIRSVAIMLLADGGFK